MNIRIFQTGWNYSQDGPGNRMMLHFQGCNFTCPWCSNPEGCPPGGTLFVRKDLLNQEVCPRGAVSPEGLDRSICRKCSGRECLTTHRNQGISFSCRDYTVEELIQQAVEARPLYFDGGGVTVSGGEATLQHASLQQLLHGLKAEGIHTALETNGSHPALFDLLKDLDLLILDLKHWNFEKAMPILGNKGQYVWSNLEKACKSGTEVLARVTVIPGFNDSEEDMREFARRLKPFASLENFRFELLYYHEYGREKWEAIGRDYHGPDGTISEEQKRMYREILEGEGLQVITS